MTLLASALGAAIALGAMQFINAGRSSTVDQQILTELKSISEAVRQRPAPIAAPAARAPEAPKDVRIAIDNAPSLGRADARVVMVEFSDFDCPFCARFSANTKDQLVREYVDSGKLRYVFRHMPLARLHPRAQRESEAAECAARQNKFWEMYPRLFTKSAMTDAELRAHALASGVSAAAFDQCFAGQATAKVLTDLNDGTRAGVSGTPMFFFGTLDEAGRVKVMAQLVGAEPMANFRSTIERLLREPQAAVNQ
jgi:protein-disulfide isomerase